ncbi:hypothetical protein L2E82_11940 [Cichorium intybus]|uniref:Uncharacterized protein n=1 Tax=Cichorium intybus TaxID=13427 RepID=A0ACB9GEL3_CICIN|nr:hypothetical protein L2E82_11940 [Cichorium intybus]
MAEGQGQDHEPNRLFQKWGVGVDVAKKSKSLGRAWGFSMFRNSWEGQEMVQSIHKLQDGIDRYIIAVIMVSLKGCNGWINGCNC